MMQSLRSTWTHTRFRPWTFPLALLALAVVSYGLRLLLLGFYWDDFPYLWLFFAHGPAGINETLGADRPLLAVIYQVFMSLLGTSPLAWQIFGLLAHWFCGLGFWLALCATWPEHKEKAGWVAALFVVYPGFTQQWISTVYGQDFVLNALIYFSLALTVWAIRKQRWVVPATIGGLLLSAFTMFSTEYYFGLELLRPALFWLVLAQQGIPPRRRLQKTLLYWLPFMLLIVFFIYYRVVLNPYPGASLSLFSRLAATPVLTLLGLAGRVLKDIVLSGPVSWGLPLQLSNVFETSMSDALQVLGVIALTAVGAWVYLSRFVSSVPEGANPLEQKTSQPWAIQAVMLGIYAMLAGGLPIWISGYPLHINFPWDRYTLLLAPGLCLLIAGAIDWLGAGAAQKALVLALILGLAAGFQYSLSDQYRNQWNAMRDLIWQLTWRAPGIRPGTALLFDQIGLTYYEDDSLTGPLNWTYNPHPVAADKNQQYLFLNIPERLLQLGELQPGKDFIKEFRAETFHGNTSQAIVLKYNPPGRLQVLDPRFDALRSDLPEDMQRALPLSAPGLILPDAPQAAPPAFFGSEPRLKWCYYYEKASAARQAGDWNQIVTLLHQSLGKGLRPGDPAEYLPFIDGLVRTWKWDDARELTLDTARMDGGTALRPTLCALWQSHAVEMGPLASREAQNLQRVTDALGCSQLKMTP